MRKKHKHHHDWGNKNDNSMRYEKAGTIYYPTGNATYQENWARIFKGEQSSTGADDADGTRQGDSGDGARDSESADEGHVVDRSRTA